MNTFYILLDHDSRHWRLSCQGMLHKWKRCLGGNNICKAGILLTFVTDIGKAVLFQDLLNLMDNNEFLTNHRLTNKYVGTTALVADKHGFRHVNNNFFNGKILSHFVNGSFVLAGKGFHI